MMAEKGHDFQYKIGQSKTYIRTKFKGLISNLV